MYGWEAIQVTVILFGTGISVLACGLFRLLPIPRASLSIAGQLALILTGSTVGNLLVDDTFLPTLGLSVGLISGSLLFTSTVLHRTLQSISRGCMSMKCRTAAMILIGLVGIGGALAFMEYDHHKSLQQDSEYLMGLCYKPDTIAETEYLGTTDLGTPLHLQKAIMGRTPEENAYWEKTFVQNGKWNRHAICREEAFETCNCHGWAFTGGRYWLSPTDVAVILKENGYTPVRMPRAGDLAIYYGTSSDIMHTAIVRGRIRGDWMVEGKWGPLGVYLHPSKECPYGSNVTFYRSNRTGHVVKGLDQAVSIPVSISTDE